MLFERHFEPTVGAIPLARHFVLDALGDVPKETFEAIAVMTSELVTNAVLHAQTEFEVHLEVVDTEVRIEVRDFGEGFPEPSIPPPNDEPHGRGLFIVKRLANEWGVTDSRDDGGKSVWFRMFLRQPAPVVQ